MNDDVMKPETYKKRLTKKIFSSGSLKSFLAFQKLPSNGFRTEKCFNKTF